MIAWSIGVTCGFFAGVLVVLAYQEVRLMLRRRRQEEPYDDWGGNLDPDDDAARIQEGFALAIESTPEPSSWSGSRHAADRPGAIPVRVLLHRGISAGTMEIPVVPAPSVRSVTWEPEPRPGSRVSLRRSPWLDRAREQAAEFP